VVLFLHKSYVTRKGKTNVNPEKIYTLFSSYLTENTVLFDWKYKYATE